MAATGKSKSNDGNGGSEEGEAGAGRGGISSRGAAARTTGLGFTTSDFNVAALVFLRLGYEAPLRKTIWEDGALEDRTITTTANRTIASRKSVGRAARRRSAQNSPPRTLASQRSPTGNGRDLSPSRKAGSVLFVLGNPVDRILAFLTRVVG
jgi:hypothetical protein